MMNKGTVNKNRKDWFGDFPTPAFLRFSSVDIEVSTEIYYSFSLVNDDGSEENNIPISFAVRYDM